MSVAIAITVTIPNSTAAKVTATGTDFALTVGPEVVRRVLAQCAGVDADFSGVTVAASVT